MLLEMVNRTAEIIIKVNVGMPGTRAKSSSTPDTSLRAR